MPFSGVSLFWGKTFLGQAFSGAGRLQAPHLPVLSSPIISLCRCLLGLGYLPAGELRVSIFIWCLLGRNGDPSCRRKTFWEESPCP